MKNAESGALDFRCRRLSNRELVRRVYRMHAQDEGLWKLLKTDPLDAEYCRRYDNGELKLGDDYSPMRPSPWEKVRLWWKWAVVYAVIGSFILPWYGYGWGAYILGFRDPASMDWHEAMWIRLFLMPWFVGYALTLHHKLGVRNEVIKAARQLNCWVGPIEDDEVSQDWIVPGIQLHDLRRAINEMEGRPPDYQPEPIRFL